MNRTSAVCSIVIAGLASIATSLHAQPRPATRAERSGYRETSLHADVIAFVDSLRIMGAPISVQSLGKSPKGKELPLVVASRPRVTTPAEARRLGRPIAYVQANIHAGEVEGKEAVLAMLRDLSFGKQPNVLDSLVLIVIPIYNADGTLGPQSRNRGAQNGPEMIGLRPNGQGFDLNRDYVKAEAPETRASLAAFNKWDPDLFMDLHTTNGSYHGYQLTYSPSLHPAAPLGAYTADTLLPEITRRMKSRHGFEIFPYGNFAGQGGRGEAPTPTSGSSWVTYEHLQRYGSNYFGLRGRISILSEAYSHDPFALRVASTRAFVQETLSLLAERAREVRSRIAAGTAASTFATAGARQIPISARFDSKPDTQVVLVEELARADTSYLAEPGMRRGFRRTGKIVPTRMPVVDRFEPVITTTPPRGYLIQGAPDSLITLLRLHGLTVTRVDAPVSTSMQVFVIDSVAFGRPFQGHRSAVVTGQWNTVTRSIPAGSHVVRMGTPLDLMAMELLEPQSDDGVLTWNAFDPLLAKGKEAPVARLLAPLPSTSPRR